MNYPGLPPGFVLAVELVSTAMLLWALVSRGVVERASPPVPGFGPLLRGIAARPRFLLLLKLLVLAVFVLVVISGLFGTRIPARNLATVLTWNLWWTLLIISVFFLGSAWCAVCPWDTLATWLVRRRWIGRGRDASSLGLDPPRLLRSVWPALILFIGLTWLELGLGITTNPYATAVLALLMVVMATASLAIYQRKAFCRWFCPVGRTVGAYSQLAPVALRPVEPDVCARCTTLECYHGSASVDPCPTRLVMGRLTQNTYCTSCGNCVQSCPHHNVAWRLRAPSVEAMSDARPHGDEAWFMLGLLALTGFHGLTMMGFFRNWMSTLAARWPNDSGLLWSFTLALLASLLLMGALFALAAWLSAKLAPKAVAFKKVFADLSFVALPLAFAYHLAHNLTHLVRESDGLAAVLANPLGSGALPLTMAERQLRNAHTLLPDPLLFSLQAGLMLFGLWIAVQVVRHRGRFLFAAVRFHWRALPVLAFVLGVTGFHLWLLSQPMMMRM